LFAAGAVIVSVFTVFVRCMYVSDEPVHVWDVRVRVRQPLPGPDHGHGGSLLRQHPAHGYEPHAQDDN
jgi:hypothetical protein